MENKLEDIMSSYILYCDDINNGKKGVYKLVNGMKIPLPFEYFCKHIKTKLFGNYYNKIILEMRNKKINKIKCQIN